MEQEQQPIQKEKIDFKEQYTIKKEVLISGVHRTDSEDAGGGDE